MKKPRQKSLIIFLSAFSVILFGGIIALLLMTKPMPIAVLQHFGIKLLIEEANVMNECAECHAAVDFHDCTFCHDDHGAIELKGIKFYEVVELTGDVPEPAFIRVNEVMPNQENYGTHILLFDFLSQNGVESFESITFTTNDGGLTTIESKYLDETAMFVPYLDGVRFVTESVHVSTWLKGIKQIIVVGEEKPILIDGERTSIGRLLLGETRKFIVEGSESRFLSEKGETGIAFVGNWVEGAPILPLLKTKNPNSVTLTDSEGKQIELEAVDLSQAILTTFRKEVTLVIPDRGRSAWPTGIVEIKSK